MTTTTSKAAPTTESRTKIFQMISAGLFVALVAAGSKLSIPFWPVPMTMQSLFVLLAGFLLSARTAFLAMVVYVLIGLMGFPVFARGGGPGYIMQPTFGYLLGYMIAAWLVARIVHGKREFSSFTEISAHLRRVTMPQVLKAGLAGTLAIFLPGVLYLYFWMQLFGADPDQQSTFLTILYSGAIVFLPGAIGKLAGIYFIIRVIAQKERDLDAA